MSSPNEKEPIRKTEGDFITSPTHLENVFNQDGAI
jgi:hypothetical protein